ncbi:MAG: sulfatase, partial [Rikenellaceae bacterium]
SKYYETPNIDKISRSGITFTNGYATCQVSSPSRASIMTGKYTPRHAITSWIGDPSGAKWQAMGRQTKMLPPEYAQNLDTSEFTIAEAMRENGYATFLAGKWHLGGDGSTPEDHGFDINIGGYEAGSPKGGYFSPYNNPKLTDGPKGENLSLRLANETAKFITNHTKTERDQPFFAYLSFYAVHGPIQTSKDRWAYYRQKADSMGIAENGFLIDRTLPVRQTQDNPIYAGLIAQMDDAIGVLLDRIEQLGLTENTIIVFTSDNGGVSSGDNFSTSNLPYRGGKGRQWEGGIREPFMISYPKAIKAGDINDTPVIGTDFYPTLLEMTSAPARPAQHLDGVSLVPLFKGDSLQPRDLFWHYPHYGNQGGDPSSIIRSGDWKLILYHEDNHVELYNLATDKTEREPLNALYPQKVTELTAKLQKWLTDVDAKFPTANKQYDPQKEAELKVRHREVTMPNLEKRRIEELSKDFTPNKTWWDSVKD